MLMKMKKKIGFFGDESNLHGVGHVFSMTSIPFFQRLFWLIILIGCSFGAWAVLRGALSLYSGDLVSYSVETNYLNFDTPFPAVTVCDHMNSMNRIKSYLVSNDLPTGLTTFLRENAYYNYAYCALSCTNCKINETCVEGFQQLVNEIRLNCTALLTNCWWDGEKFPCCERFHPIATEFGTCFVFNSRLTENDAPILTVNRKVGLPSLVLTAVHIVQIRFHAPDDLMSASMENIARVTSLPLVTDFEVIFKAEQTISDVSVNALSSGARGCLFAHEKPAHAQLWPFQVYSYNTCLLYCKAVAHVHFCNCTHHFVPKLGENPTCTLTGLACLSDYKDPLRRLKCDCPIGCEETSYQVVSTRNTRHNLTQEWIQRGTKVHVKLANLPTLRVVRRAIRTTLGLVVDIGGVGGVFFGASLLSIIEIVYLLCIRRES